MTMTCRSADSLIEDVLNGDADADGEDELREHLSHCGTCAEAWHVAWQVRQTLNRCEVPDPGEPYFAQVTSGIMARIRAIDPDAAVEGSPAITSARYGPLQIRGVGLALLMAFGFFVQAFRAPVVYSPLPTADHPRNDADRALEAANAPQANPALVDRHADTQSRSPQAPYRPDLRTARSATCLDRIRECLTAFAPPPAPQMT
jgi:hypothetical protein